jgi:hypothetical protein
MQYRDRQGATAYLRGKGVQIGDGGLKDLANRDRGPRYAIINGRALYEDSALDEWIESQAARPLPKRRRSEEPATAA